MIRALLALLVLALSVVSVAQGSKFKTCVLPDKKTVVVWFGSRQAALKNNGKWTLSTSSPEMQSDWDAFLVKVKEPSTEDFAKDVLAGKSIAGQESYKFAAAVAFPPASSSTEITIKAVDAANKVGTTVLQSAGSDKWKVKQDDQASVVLAHAVGAKSSSDALVALSGGGKGTPDQLWTLILDRYRKTGPTFVTFSANKRVVELREQAVAPVIKPPTTPIVTKGGETETGGGSSVWGWVLGGLGLVLIGGGLYWFVRPRLAGREEAPLPVETVLAEPEAKRDIWAPSLDPQPVADSNAAVAVAPRGSRVEEERLKNDQEDAAAAKQVFARLRELSLGTQLEPAAYLEHLQSSNTKLISRNKELEQEKKRFDAERQKWKEAFSEAERRWKSRRASAAPKGQDPFATLQQMLEDLEERERAFKAMDSLYAYLEGHPSTRSLAQARYHDLEKDTGAIEGYLRSQVEGSAEIRSIYESAQKASDAVLNHLPRDAGGVGISFLLLYSASTLLAANETVTGPTSVAMLQNLKQVGQKADVAIPGGDLNLKLLVDAASSLLGESPQSSPALSAESHRYAKSIAAILRSVNAATNLDFGPFNLGVDEAGGLQQIA